MGFLNIFLVLSSSAIIFLTLTQNDGLKVEKIREEFSLLEKITMSTIFFQFFLSFIKLKTNEF